MAEVQRHPSVLLGEFGIDGQFMARPGKNEVAAILWSNNGHTSVSVSPSQAEEMAALLVKAAAEARA